MDRETDEVRIEEQVAASERSVSSWVLVTSLSILSSLPLVCIKVVIFSLHAEMSEGILVSWYTEQRWRCIDVIVLCIDRSGKVLLVPQGRSQAGLALLRT